MNLPARVVDLHTHLFNARYMPLESVIASAMNKEESKLADYVAKLLYALAGSSYADAQDLRAEALQVVSEDEFYLEDLGDHPRRTDAGSPAATLAKHGPADVLNQPWNAQPLEPVASSELMEIIEQLSNIDYAAEGWIEPDPSPLHQPAIPYKQLAAAPLFVDVLDWARRVVRAARGHGPDGQVRLGQPRRELPGVFPDHAEVGEGRAQQLLSATTSSARATSRCCT